MKNKIKMGSAVFDTINTGIMALLAFVTFYPIIHILFASFSNGTDLLSHTGLLFKPIGFTTGAYKLVFKDPMILLGYGNTIFIVVVGVTINMILTILGAYFVSRKNVMFIKPVMLYIIFTMFFSGGIIPFFLTVKELKLDNTLWALIIPTAVNAFNLIIMKTGFESIPESLEEAAKIEGAGHLRILTTIVVPLSMPIIAVIVLYYAVAHWNAWFNAMIFIRERKLYPLQLILRGILLQNDTNAMTTGISSGDQESVSEAVKYAVIMVATLPILCVYPFLQKYFVKGIMIGAVKG